MIHASATVANWEDAFPLQAATAAVKALCDSWNILTSTPRSHFNRNVAEPILTKALKTHVERVTAREAGLLGMWAAENVIATMNFDSGEITEERRNDIVYGWNNDTISLQLVFEFKKLSHTARSRKMYIGSEGLGRFVTGIYSRQQLVAAMVGLLLSPHADVVPPLIAALEDEAAVNKLRIVKGSDNKSCGQPSSLFASADFDTIHDRPAELAPTNGTIRVAHLFLSFE